MADEIRIEAAELRAAAQHHLQASAYLASIPASHSEIQQSLDSLGPIYADLREAGRELLEQRAACYREQAGAHAELAGDLTDAADRWEQHETEAAAKFRALADDTHTHDARTGDR